MENNELNEKVIKNVRNRIAVSNLESEEKMKISKRKQILSIAAICMILLTGSFVTVNAATDGKLVENVKDTIKTVKVRIVKNGDITEVKAMPVDYDVDYNENGNAMISYHLVDSDVDVELEGKDVVLQKGNIELEENMDDAETEVYMTYDYDYEE